MKRVLPFWILLSVWLLACALISRPPDVEVTPPAATREGTATPTATETPTPLPPRPTDTVTPQPTSTPAPTLASLEPPGKGYVVEEERQIGGYIVRLWRNTSPDSIGFDSIVTLSGGGQPEVQIEMVFDLGEETGTDLTGDGHPDAVIRVFTGGAHCCFSTIVYDLGPTLTKVLETPLSNCDGNFEDLDGDGIAEFLTCEDLFAYAYCAYAVSPAVQVVLQYDAQRGYVPASPRFARAYTEAIAQHVQMAENAQPGEMGEWDGSTKCAVLPLVLDYLYAGQDEQAWAEFSRLYDGLDLLLFWGEVVQAIADSPLYVPGEASVDVPWPPYYTLQLYPGCGPSDMQHAVRVLMEGQSADKAPCRDIYWLQTQLRRADILAEGEMLILAPEGCTDVCRLDVMRMSDNAQMGGVRLDTEVGFPGEVYRVDGQEGEHWRLRGDLTWERVSQ
jgi:hypothetical protein